MTSFADFLKSKKCTPSDLNQYRQGPNPTRIFAKYLAPSRFQVGKEKVKGETQALLERLYQLIPEDNRAFVRELKTKSFSELLSIYLTSQSQVVPTHS